MKKKTLPIIFILLIYYGTFAQIKSNYTRGFEIGFAEGYCYNRQTVDCFRPITPLAPLPRINENKENYTEGYNRGFQYGLDLKRNNNTSENGNTKLNNRLIQFNNYISQNPVSEMVAVGMYKQEKYDARLEWMQSRIYGLVGIRETLYNNFPGGNAAKERENKYLQKRINSYAGSDFADDYIFNQIKSVFNEIERSQYNNYKYLVNQQNKISEKQIKVKYSEQKISELTPSQFENFFTSKHIGKIFKFRVYEVEKDSNNKYSYKTETHFSNVQINKTGITYTLKNGKKRFRTISQKTYDKENNRFICYSDYGTIIISSNLSSIIFFNASELSHRYVLIENN